MGTPARFEVCPQGVAAHLCHHRHSESAKRHTWLVSNESLAEHSTSNILYRVGTSQIFSPVSMHNIPRVQLHGSCRDIAKLSERSAVSAFSRPSRLPGLHILLADHQGHSGAQRVSIPSL